ncbi:hypothetical protein LCGC14_1618330 [marine sediment metagenome]|uniref:Uncharacterized protein n=1 Tax=marine sediment metagenome TaxID=412755 RepID=A0A0F9I6I2_9ZZZZ
MNNVLLSKLNPGDLVRVVWKDNYRTHDSLPGAPMQAESFGRVVEVSEEGLALFQNRVLNAEEIGAIECMDGQLILSTNILSIEVLS